MTTPKETLAALLDQIEAVREAVRKDPDFHISHMLDRPPAHEAYTDAQDLARRLTALVEESSADMSTEELRRVLAVDNVTYIDWDRTEDLGNTKESDIVCLWHTKRAVEKVLAARAEASA